MKSIKHLIKEDKKSNSKSFFLKKKNFVANSQIYNFLEDFYKKNFKTVRVCMHSKPSEKIHSMIILMGKNNFYAPHKHLLKKELYHIIKGSMAVILFSNNGRIKKIVKLIENNIFITPVNVYHTMIPLSKFVIFHEIKSGPFIRKNNSLLPKWINKYSSSKDIDLFKKKVKGSLNA